ncbi:MAG TPA: bifunctional 5,10-methylenetetrahydrofolate dehydrogenase/5,10-methenyltetrahydrofolate cyclohydrolase [Candidatus Scatomorpha stercoravium]|nr:bifunctional 5,10-methylenetetrahydrofolate dehydrogenase/5,10-methenyltetrahydrofolate cyclohydrolase [Candidatus Scatomorpha stercoravium]
MATILKGARAAAALDEKTLAAISGLRARGIRPGLGILRAGERPDDLAYERGAIKRCEKLGIAVKSVVLPENVNHHALIAQLQRLNSDSSVHGVLMFRPLPAHIDERAACEALMVSKDVDGITSGSAASLYTGGGDGFAPCTAEAVISILRNYGVQIEGKRAAVVGRSLVIGRPVAMMLMQRNATVTICHSRTENLAEITRGADIVVAALGRAETLTAEYFSPGQTVIDVGINYSEAKGRLVGDVDFEAVEPIVEAISPVPAGVGSVTTAMLARHVVKAAGGAL